MSSDDVRERAHMFLLLQQPYGERKGEGEKRRKEREEKKKELSETGGAEGSAGWIFSVINHASLQQATPPLSALNVKGRKFSLFFVFSFSVGEDTLKIFLTTNYL